MKRKTTDEVIEKFINKHKNKYDYSNVRYVNTYTKVCIICQKHGEFWQRPSDHLKGQGCPKCATEVVSSSLRSNDCNFIQKANKIHNFKYDYSKVNYINSSTKVCIICPIHGEFFQLPTNHLSGRGCNKCKNEKNSYRCRYSKNEFIEKSNTVHHCKYDYSKVNYINSTTKVCIICPEHGEFWQLPSDHMYGHGCSKCGNKRGINFINCNLKNFIRKSNHMHNFVYDYSRVKYTNNRANVCIICPEHGEFWQTPHDHLQGCGCPKCNSSHIENEIRNLLLKNGYIFEEQKKFDWLGKQSLDFYLYDHKIAIECQGIQHFEPIEHFGGQEALTETIKRDNRKKQLCEENGIKLLYYANYVYEFPYAVITDKYKLIEKIKKHE